MEAHVCKWWLGRIGFMFLLVLLPIVGWAAGYPERPIMVILPTGPGGPLDLSTRALVSAAEKELGQAIVAENKPGGGGTVGLSIAATAKPDGYVLCGGSSSPMIRAPLLQKVPFKPLASFTPIFGFARPHSGLVVKSDAPWKNLREFLDYAKKNPGKIKYSTPGTGTAMHQAMGVVALKEDIKWVHVPYIGPAPALAALLGGHVDACCSGADFLLHVNAGSLRLIAANGETRTAQFPDVPTLKESGYDFVDETVFGIVAPAGLPGEVVRRLEVVFGEAAETNQFKSTLASFDLAPARLNSKEFGEYLRDFWFRTEKSLKEMGLIKEPATQPY